MDQHHGPGKPPAGVKAGQCRSHDHQAGPEGENVEVTYLKGPDGAGMSDQIKDRGRGKIEQGEKDRGKQGKVNALPEGGPHSIECPRTGILGHERVDIVGHPHEKGDGRKRGDARRECRADGIHGVTCQEYPVRELHEGDGAHGRNQGEADGQDIPVPVFSFPAIGHGSCKKPQSPLMALGQWSVMPFCE